MCVEADGLVVLLVDIDRSHLVSGDHMLQELASDAAAARFRVDEQHLQLLRIRPREADSLTLTLGDDEVHVRQVGRGEARLDIRSMLFGEEIVRGQDRAAPDRHERRELLGSPGWADHDITCHARDTRRARRWCGVTIVCADLFRMSTFWASVLVG